jgi:uncharacterized repeat protein (TIGR02543 family)
MPANDVTLTANYVAVYALTVVNGTPETATLEAGEAVTVTADAAAEGFVFDGWTSDGVALADATSEVQSFAMPANDVTLTANYVAVYALTVVNGTPKTATLKAGEFVTVTADAAPSGMEFSKWEANGVELDNVKSQEISFNMPANAVTLTATYKTLLPEEWPTDLELYTPADGRNFREGQDLAVTFSWPEIRNAENYRLVIVTNDGMVGFDETI